MTTREAIARLSGLIARRNCTATEAMRAAGVARRAERDLARYLTEVEKIIPEAAKRETQSVTMSRGKRLEFVGQLAGGVSVMEPR